MRKWPAVGVLLAVAWLFVRGTTLAPTRLVATGLTGLLVGLPLAYAVRGFYTERTPLRRNLRAVPTAVRYITAFLRELLVANVDVAYRVLAPWMPIDPALVRFPLRVESDAAVTTIANSITLTPGTLTLDHDPDEDRLLIHGLAVDDPVALTATIRRWEDLALVIFDEELTPDDSPPAPATVVSLDETAMSGTGIPEEPPSESAAADPDDASAAHEVGDTHDAPVGEADE
jgi:multicomponent Na+:H+ antiporter subunit E